MALIGSDTMRRCGFAVGLLVGGSVIVGAGFVVFCASSYIDGDTEFTSYCLQNKM